jgi:cellulose 1,4-beta-cellobiosidase
MTPLNTGILVVCIILSITALVLGLYFGLSRANGGGGGGGGSGNGSTSTLPPISAGPAVSVHNVPTTEGNPFDESSHDFFINPHYKAEIQASSLTDSQKNVLSDISSAYWIDNIAAISTRENSFKDALDAAIEQKGKKITVVFIVYNLPNRDCKAAASNGEICCDGGTPDPNTGDCSDAAYSDDCTAGLNIYKNEYIDPIFNLITDSAYSDLELVAIIEPDSLPNGATNLGQGHCTTTTLNAYRDGIEYTLTKLSTVNNLTMYIDIAHGGWLGWCGAQPCAMSNSNENAQKFVTEIKTIFDDVGPTVAAKVRGFATNTSNYQPLGYPNNIDPCDLESQYNFAGNEIKYINQMSSLFDQAGITGKKFITDTGRNGYDQARVGSTECQQWCNVKGGIGLKPSSQTTNPDLIDAWYWLKTPGESDGCQGTYNSEDCVREDAMCAQNCDDGYQLCPAPEAGQWFDEELQVLVDNACTTSGCAFES